jgi:hypothetical protein
MAMAPVLRVLSLAALLFAMQTQPSMAACKELGSSLAGTKVASECTIAMLPLSKSCNNAMIGMRAQGFRLFRPPDIYINEDGQMATITLYMDWSQDGSHMELQCMIDQ